MAENEKSDPGKFVKLVTYRVERQHCWAMWLWWIYILGKIVSYITGIIVPFGLAALYYLPELPHKNIQILLLGVSFINLIFQGVLDIMHIRDRAVQRRKLHKELESNLAKYLSNLITIEALINSYDKNQRDLMERDLP